MSRPYKWPLGAVSHSRLKTLRACPKKHHLKYHLKLVPVGGLPSEALDVGKAFHHGLEIVGRAASLGKETHLGLWETAAKIAQASADDPKAGVEALRLLGSYRLRYGLDNAGFGERYRVDDVEALLASKSALKALGGLAAIADAHLTDLETGLPVIVEYKTAGRAPSKPGGGALSEAELARKWLAEDQVMTLAHCGREAFGVIPRVLRRMVVKTKTPAHLEALLTVTPEALERWEENLSEIEVLSHSKCANYDNCAPAMGFECEYLDFCFPENATGAVTYETKKG